MAASRAAAKMEKKLLLCQVPQHIRPKWPGKLGLRGNTAASSSCQRTANLLRCSLVRTGNTGPLVRMKRARTKLPLARGQRTTWR